MDRLGVSLLALALILPSLATAVPAKGQQGAPAPPAVTAAPPAEPDQEVVVEVQGYLHQTPALDLAQRLSRTGLKARMIRRPGPAGGPEFVVVVGPFKKEAEARRVRTELREKHGRDSRIVPVALEATGHVVGALQPMARLDKAPPRSEPEPAKPAAAKAGGFYVQVATYAGPIQAGRLAEQIKAQGFPARVAERASSGGRRLYVVLVGDYTSLAEARKVVEELAGKFKLRAVLREAPGE